MPDFFHVRLVEHLRRYFACGGMPEALGRWVETGDIVQVDKVLSDLLDSYERDFAKHGGRAQFAKLSQIWNSIPAQLARENKKFVWGAVREGARAREYEDALEWLADAGLITAVRLNAAGGVPLSAYDDLKAFKVYCLDVGLLRRMARLDASAFAISDALFSEFKGSFAENLCASGITFTVRCCSALLDKREAEARSRFFDSSWKRNRSRRGQIGRGRSFQEP